jgi:hypothetical protein
VVTQVDAAGSAVSTWANASSVQWSGLNFTYSVRQLGPLSGSVTLGVNHDRNDASNLPGATEHVATSFLSNTNVTCKATPRLDLSAYFRLAPTRSLAQGHASTYKSLDVGSGRAWVVGEIPGGSSRRVPGSRAPLTPRRAGLRRFAPRPPRAQGSLHDVPRLRPASRLPRMNSSPKILSTSN